MPLKTMASARVTMAPMALIWRTTWIVEHLRVNSTISVSGQRQLPSGVCLFGDVEALDMVGVFRLNPHTRSVAQPQT